MGGGTFRIESLMDPGCVVEKTFCWLALLPRVFADGKGSRHLQRPHISHREHRVRGVAASCHGHGGVHQIRLTVCKNTPVGPNRQYRLPRINLFFPRENLSEKCRMTGWVRSPESSVGCTALTRSPRLTPFCFYDEMCGKAMIWR